MVSSLKASTFWVCSFKKASITYYSIIIPFPLYCGGSEVTETADFAVSVDSAVPG